MLNRISAIFQARDLLKNLVLRDFKLKYTNSFFGVAWAIINPLLVMLVVTFVFTKIIKVALPRFPLFVLSTIFPWMWFSVSVQESASSFLGQTRLFNQFNVPKELFPISSLLANFLNFLLGWLLILPVFIISKPHVVLLFFLLFPLIVLQLIFTIGTGLIFSCLTVFFRDIGKLLEVLLMFWFWMTPVFYSIDMVPREWSWLIFLNPMTVYIEAHRTILFDGVFPPARILWAASGWSVSFFCFGFWVFSKIEPQLVKRF